MHESLSRLAEPSSDCKLKQQYPRRGKFLKAISSISQCVRRSGLGANKKIAGPRFLPSGFPLSENAMLSII